MAKLILNKPIQLENTSIDSLTFREYVTAGDLLAFDQSGFYQQQIHFIANLTGTDAVIIQRLHHADFEAAQAIAEAMLGDEDLTEAQASEKKPKS